MSSKKGNTPTNKPTAKVGADLRRTLQSLSATEKLQEVVAAEEREEKEQEMKKNAKDIQEAGTSKKKSPKEDTAKVSASSSSETGCKDVKIKDSATSDSSEKSAADSAKPVSSELQDSVQIINERVATALTLGSDKPEEVKTTESKDPQIRPTNLQLESQHRPLASDDPPNITPKQEVIVSPPKRVVDLRQEVIASPPSRVVEPLDPACSATGGDLQDPEDLELLNFSIEEDSKKKQLDLKRACIDMYMFQRLATSTQESVEAEINTKAPELREAITNAHSILAKIAKFQEESNRTFNEETLRMQNDRMKLLISRSSSVFKDLENAVGNYRQSIMQLMEETCSSHVEMDTRLEKIITILCDDYVSHLEQEPDVKFQKK